MDASGHLETGFGSGGFVATAHPVFDLAVVGNRILALDEGALIVVLGTDGAPDPAYLAQIHLPWDVTPLGVENRGDGFLIVGTRNDGTAVVGGFLASGASDPSFGSGGLTPFVANLSSTIFGEPVRVAYGPLGRIFIAVNGTIVALDAAGHLDTTFAPGDPGGAAAVLGSGPPPACGVCGMTVDSAGRILVTRGGTTAIWIERLLPTGALDPTFGDQGVRLVGQEGLGLSPQDLRSDPQGRLVALATADNFSGATDVVVARLDPSAPSPLPRVLVDPATVNENQVSFVHVHLDQASSVPVVVKLDVVLNGTATAADIGALSSPVWISAGQTAVDVVLPIVDDHLVPDHGVEGDKTFDVQVTGAYQATGEGTRSTVTIVDNDRVATVFGRVAGADRYDTAALLSQKTFSAGVGVAYIATGQDYPDAPRPLPRRSSAADRCYSAKPRRSPLPRGPSSADSSPRRSSCWAAPRRSPPACRRPCSSTPPGRSPGCRAPIATPPRPRCQPPPSPPEWTPCTWPPARGSPTLWPVDRPQVCRRRVAGPCSSCRRTCYRRPHAPELQRLGAQHIVVLGGSSAVSDDVVAALGPFSAHEVVRRAGADRYLTAVEVSNASFATASAVFLATGVTFPDALPGGTGRRRRQRPAAAHAPRLHPPGRRRRDQPAPSQRGGRPRRELDPERRDREPQRLRTAARTVNEVTPGLGPGASRRPGQSRFGGPAPRRTTHGQHPHRGRRVLLRRHRRW